MKKSIYFLLLLFCFSINTIFAQEKKRDLYKPEADAAAIIDSLLVQAKAENKHLILQVGGNWCGWCYRFHDFIQQDSLSSALIEENYLIYHLNYSKENQNEALLAKYEYPQRFGFPVLVVLDADGNRLHTQDSWMLEAEKGYDPKKVPHFFKSWTPSAIDPESYKKK